MFKPARIKKLKIITLDKYAEAAVNSLHESSTVQIYDISERIQEDAEWKQILKPSHATPFLGKISSILMKTTGMSDFLESVSIKDKGILTLAKGFVNPPRIDKKEVEDLGPDKLLGNAEDTLNRVESKTKPLDEKLNELDAENSRLENAIKVAQNLIKFNFELGDLADSKYVSIVSGKISLDSYEQFKLGMKNLPEEILVEDDDNTDKEFKTLVIITLKANEDKISGLLRKLEFERFDLSGISGKPEEIIKNSE